MLNFLFKAEPRVLRFQVDLNRCIEGIHYIAELKPGVTQFYIGKIFYFADKAHFLDWGRPISGDRYIAMEHGPVPSTIYDLLKEDAGEPDEVIDTLLKRVEIKSDGNKRRVYSRGTDDFPHLSGTGRDYLRKAVEEYGCKSFGEIKRLAHQSISNRLLPEKPENWRWPFRAMKSLRSQRNPTSIRRSSSKCRVTAGLRLPLATRNATMGLYRPR